jgi:Secretion system C-terminal sorting domain
MKKLLYTFSIIVCVAQLHAQVFNFYGNVYYLSPDETSGPGTVLENSSTNLSGFDFNTAPSDHPLYENGVFYPIQDCSNQNLWIRVQHIAADPNGTENGHMILNSMNSPFLPYGSTDRIGGWNGFLYEFQIFQDQVLVGTRTNVLGNLFPTGITVASLETLYNDGGTLFEWLSFEIINSESSGWYLNSTNFTGINPYSTPGFSDSLYYATTGTSVSTPIGFSTDFPYGTDSLYAVDMNLSSSYHSEFRMSAAGVSKFRYGYEFTSGGYQGMSMEFGVPPVVNAYATPSCGDNNGSITLEVTGTEPITFNWGDGNTTATASELAAGEYIITVSDANGCSITQSVYIEQFDTFDVTINETSSEGMSVLDVILAGGLPDFSYEWGTGESTPSITVVQDEMPQVITLQVTDANGCVATAEFIVISVNETSELTAILVSPNPVRDLANFSFSAQATDLRITNAMGQVIQHMKINNRVKQVRVDFSALPGGFYFYQLMDENDIVGKGMLVVE